MNLTDKITFTWEDHMALMSRYPDDYFDLGIVDPVYGIDGNSHRKNSSRTKLTKAKDYHTALWDQSAPTEEYFKELLRVTKNQIIWGINYYNSPLLTSSGRIVWDKVNGDSTFSDAEIAYASMFESVRIVKYMWNGMQQGATISRESSVQQGNKKLNEVRIHPTQKPVKLYDWLLIKYAKKGFKILDTGVGSGSLLIAAHDRYELDLEVVGCELEEIHYREAVARFLIHKNKNKIIFPS